MDKNFESLPKTNISLIKKMMGNSINEKSTQSFNSMTKQKINTQIQSSKARINSSIFLKSYSTF